MKGDSIEIDSKEIPQKILYGIMHSCIHVQVAPDFLGDILVQKKATYTRINTVVVTECWNFLFRNHTTL